jgi:hypothetical protein
MGSLLDIGLGLLLCKIMKHDSFLWARRVLASLTSHPPKGCKKEKEIGKAHTHVEQPRCVDVEPSPTRIQIIQNKAYSIYIPLCSSFILYLRLCLELKAYKFPPLWHFVLVLCFSNTKTITNVHLSENQEIRKK